MKGEMIIKATEHGYGIDMDLEQVSTADKFELLHSVAVGLGMSKFDMFLFNRLEASGVLDEATCTKHCEDDAELDRMLQGQGQTKPGADAELKDALAALLHVLEGQV